MLGIGRQTDYAARIVLHLASLEAGQHASIAAIAERRLLPLPFIRRIVARLVAAGILETIRGASGGVRLARPAADISLLDVVQAMEGHVVLNRCVDEPRTCPLSATCPVQRQWTLLTHQLEAAMGGVRFDVLAGRLDGAVRPATGRQDRNRHENRRNRRRPARRKGG